MFDFNEGFCNIFISKTVFDLSLEAYLYPVSSEIQYAVLFSGDCSVISIDSHFVIHGDCQCILCNLNVCIDNLRLVFFRQDNRLRIITISDRIAVLIIYRKMRVFSSEVVNFNITFLAYEFKYILQCISDFK